MSEGPPIDRGWAWMILLGSHICLAFLIGGYKSLGIIFVEFKELFGASTAKTALLMGLIPGGMSVLSPFSTAIGERTSFRMVAMVGGVICCLGTFLTAFAPNMLYVILAFGLLTGIGYGFVFSPSVVVLGQYFHKRRSFANGLAFAGGSIGQLLIPLILRALTDKLGFRYAMTIYAGLMLHIVVGAALFRPISSYLTSKPDVANIPVEKGTKSDDVCEKCNKVIKSSEREGRRVSESEHLINKPLEDVRREIKSHAGIPEVKITTSSTSKDDLEADTDQNGHLLLDGCRCSEDGGMYEKFECVSTGSLCYMQEPPQLSGPSVEDIAKKTTENNQGSLCQAISASFCCCCIDKAPYVKPLFNWKLFRDPLYVLWVLGICVGNCGYVSSVVFLPPYLAQIGVSKNTAAIILSGAGVCDLIGRIGGGWFGDLGIMQRHNFMGLCMALTSAACLAFSLIENLWAAILYAAFVGVVGGCYIAMMAVVLVDFIGLAQLPNGFGIGVMFMGLFNVPPPAILGLLRDYADGYSAVYVVNAILMGLCAFLFFGANIVYFRRKKKSESK